MSNRKWTRPNRCDNSGPNCVEVGTDSEFPGVRFVRSSQDPTEVVRFDADEWAAFEQSVRAGQQF